MKSVISADHLYYSGLDCLVSLTTRSRLSKMQNMEKSVGFYAFVAGILVVVAGLLVGLGLTGKWIAFITIAILFLLLFVLLSDMPEERRSSR